LIELEESLKDELLKEYDFELDFDSPNLEKSSVILIPIVFWVYQDGISFDPPPPTLDQIQAAVDETNAKFWRNSLPFKFYIKCIRNVNVGAIPININWPWLQEISNVSDVNLVSV